MHFRRVFLCVASSLQDPLYLKSRCFWISMRKQNVCWDLRGHSIYFVAIVELEGLPYLLVTSRITVLLATVSIGSILLCVLLLFHICRCSSAFGLQFCRTQTKLICKLKKKNKKKKWAKRKGRGLQKAVKLCSVSLVMHAVFNLLCASWRLRERAREREGIMLRNDRVAVTSKLSLEIQDIDFA